MIRALAVAALLFIGIHPVSPYEPSPCHKILRAHQVIVCHPVNPHRVLTVG